MSEFKKVLIGALALGILFMAFGSSNGGKKNQDSTKQNAKVEQQAKKTNASTGQTQENKPSTLSPLQKESDDFKGRYNKIIHDMGVKDLDIGGMKITDGSAFALSHYEFNKDLMIDVFHEKNSKKVEEFMVKVFTRLEYDEDKKREKLDNGVAVFSAAIKAYNPDADVETILSNIEARRSYGEWGRNTEFAVGGVTYYTERAGDDDLCAFGVIK